MPRKGTLRLLGNAQLTIGDTPVNNGVLDIMTWSGALSSNVFNNGTILDRNAIKVQSFSVNGRDVEMTIMGYADHSYQLQHANDLSPAWWTNLGAPQVGNQAPLVFVHTNGVASGGFYRVAVAASGDSN